MSESRESAFKDSDACGADESDSPDMDSADTEAADDTVDAASAEADPAEPCELEEHPVKSRLAAVKTANREEQT
ncbi:MAG: hypothetical protein U0L49_05075 [Eubacterium sp.]|nr:hypothetical protein [Eubacterium sp.]